MYLFNVGLIFKAEHKSQAAKEFVSSLLLSTELYMMGVFLVDTLLMSSLVILWHFLVEVSPFGY